MSNPETWPYLLDAEALRTVGSHELAKSAHRHPTRATHKLKQPRPKMNNRYKVTYASEAYKLKQPRITGNEKHYMAP